MSNSRADALGNPHPISQHRTPGEIAADEAGPIGHPDPDADVKRVYGESAPRRPASGRSTNDGTPRQKGGNGKKQ
jgi:hypothetical protein